MAPTLGQPATFLKDAATLTPCPALRRGAIRLGHREAHACRGLRMRCRGQLPDPRRRRRASLGASDKRNGAVLSEPPRVPFLDVARLLGKAAVAGRKLYVGALPTRVSIPMDACAAWAARVAIAVRIAGSRWSSRRATPVCCRGFVAPPVSSPLPPLPRQLGGWAAATPTPQRQLSSDRPSRCLRNPRVRRGAISAATAANTAVVSSIRVLVMSYMPRLLLDRRPCGEPRRRPLRRRRRLRHRVCIACDTVGQQTHSGRNPVARLPALEAERSPGIGAKPSAAKPGRRPIPRLYRDRSLRAAKLARSREVPPNGGHLARGPGG